MIKIAERAKIAAFEALAIFAETSERERAGQSILSLSAGEPGHFVPDSVMAAITDTLRQHPLCYTMASGNKELRTSISEHYRRFYQLSEPVDSERIAVTSGSSCGFILAFLAAFNPGDRVGLFAPYYPAYLNILTTLGLRPVSIRLYPEENFVANRDTMEAWQQRDGGKLDGLIISSPANPTGAMLSDSDLAGISDWCVEHGVRIISDEVYHGITFGDDAISFTHLNSDAIIVNSFSKFFGLTGWRIGWMVLPPDLIEPVTRLTQSLFIAAPTISQFAATAALQDYTPFRTRVGQYRENRDQLLASLPDLGLHPVSVPLGGFYLYVDVGAVSNDSREYCAQLLDAGLAITPGHDFDSEFGAQRVRFSFCVSPENINATIEIIRKQGS